LLLLKSRKKKAATPGGLPVALREKTMKDTDGRRTRSPITNLGIIMKTTFSIFAFALLAAGGAVAGEPSGVQRFEEWGYYSADDGTAIPVPCIGPDVYMEGTEHAVVFVRDFYSRDGMHHLIVQFRNDVDFHDQYGNFWIGSGVGTIKDITLGVAETYSYVVHFLFKPVLGDGPIWQMQNMGKLRVNADGRIVVERPAYESWEQVERCLPAKKK
jgi:hypothetical protein